MTTGPISRQERLIFLDALRGIALCGIFVVNITQMGDTWYQAFPRELQSLASPSWWVWIVTHVFFSDTMRALFSLLFGAGLVLMASRGMEKSIYWRRNIFLILFGVAHGTLLLWPGEILFVYGVSAILLFPLRNARTAVLWRWAIALLIAFTMLASLGGVDGARDYAFVQDSIALQESGTALTEEQQEAVERWKDSPLYRPISETEWAQEQSIRLGGYLGNVRLSAQQFIEFQFYSDESIGIIFETVATILLGMALFSSGIISGERSHAFYKKLMLSGYAIGLTLRILTTSAAWKAGIFEPVWYDLVLYEPARIAMSLGHIGLFFMLFQSFKESPIWRALARMGQMALTSYIGQSVIAAVLFFGFGFGLFGKFDWLELMLVAAVVLEAQGIFSYFWLAHFRFGPLEWLWRSLTYWKLQALR